MTRLRTTLAAILAMVLSLAPVQAQRPTLDGVLSAYLGGDVDVIQRTFRRSVDFHAVIRLDRPRDLDRWLGSWNRGKALLLLEMARTSAGVAPQYVPMIMGAGRRYLAANIVTDGTIDFRRLWHRAAIAVLLGSGDPRHVEEHLTNAPADARLLLARAVAQERRCWAERPSLAHPAVRVDALLATAGFRVPDDVVGPSKSEREAAVARHGVCLREALSRFEAAAAMEDVKAEALVRGGWILIQDDRPKEAIEWLDAAEPHDDRDLEYWHALFRGRALEALARSKDAVDEYRAALALYPRAQSAGVGLSIALMHLDRTKEADEIARSVREGDALTPDPWLHYVFGDRRFAGRWIESRRAAAR